MRRLHQLQKDLDRVGDAGAVESEKETRRLRTLTRGGRALLIERGLDQYE